MACSLFSLAPRVAGSGLVNVVIDTPRGSQIEHFFVSYNLAQGRRFAPVGRRGPREAERLLDAAIAKHAREG